MIPENPNRNFLNSVSLPSQHTLVTEIRELIFPEDRPRYDELVYRRSSGGKMSSRMDYYDTHRVSISQCFLLLPLFFLHIRVTFHSFNLILYERRRIAGNATANDVTAKMLPLHSLHFQPSDIIWPKHRSNLVCPSHRQKKSKFA